MFTTLRAKVLSGFFFILLLLIGLGIYAISSFGSLASITTTGLEQNAESGIANFSMYESLVRIESAELRMLSADSGKSRQILAEEPSKFYLALQNAEQNVTHVPQEVRDTTGALLAKLEIAWQDYQTHLDLFDHISATEPTRSRKLLQQTLSPEMDTLKSITTTLAEQNFLAFRAARMDAVERARGATVGVIIVTIIAILAGIAGSFLITRRTILPLKNLTDSVKQLQAGHLGARIPISGADEISDLGFEFNRLTERLQEYESMNINEILREKQKSESIIESIEDPLLFFNASGELLLMNAAAQEITGITEQTALGRPLRELFRDPKLLKDIERAIEHAAYEPAPDKQMEEGLQTPPIVTITRKNRDRYFRLRIGRIFIQPSQEEEQRSHASEHRNKTLLGILVFFTDITHFKELDKMKSDFIAKVSHEFRTPLTSMTMSLDILAEEMVGGLNVEQHDIIETSRQDARRLSKLIRDLLALSRLENRKTGEALSEAFDLAAATHQLVRSLTPLYQEKGVRIELAEVPRVTLRMSREDYISILSNLYSNALKHTPAHGEVWTVIEYSEESHLLTIVVQDTGIGIAAEDQKRIFEKFVQVKHTDASTPGSVGLGLAIVRELSARYNGDIKVYSVLGEGSRFTVTLKVESMTTVIAAAQEPTRDENTL